MHTEPKTLLSKILKEHIGSTLQGRTQVTSRIRSGIGLHRVMLIIQKEVSLLN